MYLNRVGDVVITWKLHLPVKSVPIIIKGMSLNPAYGKEYSIQHYVIKFVSGFSRYSDVLQQ